MSTLKNIHRQAKSRRDGKPAFTLLELIVVLLVLGILAAIAVPTFNRVKENSVVRVAQTTLETIDRNGEAIAVSDVSLSDSQIAQAALAEMSPQAGMTITRDGAEIVVEYTNASATAEGSVTFSGGIGTIADAAITGGGGGGGFQTQSTAWSWISTTIISACGNFHRITLDTDPEVAGSVAGWEYSINGAAFSTWLPANQTLMVHGEMSEAYFEFPGDTWGLNADSSIDAVCAMTSGQQIQFKTPSGLYSPVLTIS